MARGRPLFSFRLGRFRAAAGRNPWGVPGILNFPRTKRKSTGNAGRFAFYLHRDAGVRVAYLLRAVITFRTVSESSALHHGEPSPQNRLRQRRVIISEL